MISELPYGRVSQSCGAAAVGVVECSISRAAVAPAARVRVLPILPVLPVFIPFPAVPVRAVSSRRRVPGPSSRPSGVCRCLPSPPVAPAVPPRVAAAYYAFYRRCPDHHGAAFHPRPPRSAAAVHVGLVAALPSFGRFASGLVVARHVVPASPPGGRDRPFGFFSLPIAVMARHRPAIARLCRVWLFDFFRLVVAGVVPARARVVATRRRCGHHGR